jgi:UPF0176 protein
MMMNLWARRCIIRRFPCYTRKCSKITDAHNMVSFFKFFPISDPVKHVEKLKVMFTNEGYKGTLYIANEGLNGSFFLPVKDMDIFHSTLQNNFDTKIHLNIAETYNTLPDNLPFKKLVVKVRDQVLRDGFTNSMTDANASVSVSASEDEFNFDWNDGTYSGIELSASEWHNVLSKAADDGNSDVVLIDCRNDYESDIGSFCGSLKLNTNKFSDTWKKLDSLLEKIDIVDNVDVKKSVKIYTFCTGGIRCAKTNYYLKKKHGFENVYGLQDGIIAYEKWQQSDNKNNKNNENTSLFEGENFLFDQRRLEENQ